MLDREEEELLLAPTGEEGDWGVDRRLCGRLLPPGGILDGDKGRLDKGDEATSASLGHTVS